MEAYTAGFRVGVDEGNLHSVIGGMESGGIPSWTASKHRHMDSCVFALGHSLSFNCHKSAGIFALGLAYLKQLA